jgi:AGCS family alanine or glycine:cation symporter
MEAINSVMQSMNGIVWGPVMIVLLVGTGLYLTVGLRFVQFRRLGHSVKCISGVFDDPEEEGDVSHFQALAAALSATIGTGNIAGVATAIALGGPGAVFWMWVTALVGMATKFASCSLATRFRTVYPDGSVGGGPMFFLAHARSGLACIRQP